MSLKERLNSDLRDAMRSGEEHRKSALRLALAALHNAEIEAGGESERRDVEANLLVDEPEVEEGSGKERQERSQREDDRSFPKARQTSHANLQSPEL